MSGYETAPATVLLATECACCARPLVDAVSIETGMGPICRAKHGYSDEPGPADAVRFGAYLGAYNATVAGDRVLSLESVDGETRVLANRIVHRIACGRESVEQIARLVAALDALGFSTLARRIAKRMRAVEVTTEGDALVVRAPFSLAFNDAVRACRGQRFDRDRKVRVVPRAQRVQLWEAIRQAFGPGTIVCGTAVAYV